VNDREKCECGPKCSCDSSEVLLFPCSGGSNVGQITNAAAVTLTRQGQGKMSCLAGLGGDVTGMVESTKSADACVAIDGCPVGCAALTLRRHGVTPQMTLVVTDLGIEKNKNFDLPADQVARVCEALARKVSAHFAGGE